MTELASQIGVRVALDFAFPGEFFPPFYPSPPRAALSRERALGGTVAVTGTVDDTAAVSTRSLSGIAAVALSSAATLNRQLAFAGTATVTTHLTAATASYERSFGGYLTVELVPTAELTVRTPRPLRVHVVQMPDRKPITLTMPGVQASPAGPLPTEQPVVTVTMPPPRVVTCTMPDRAPIVLKMARGRGTPPPSWRPSFAVRDAAGSYR